MMSSDASCTGCVVEYRGTCTSTSTVVQENFILDHKLGKIWDGAVLAVLWEESHFLLLTCHMAVSVTVHTPCVCICTRATPPLDHCIRLCPRSSPQQLQWTDLWVDHVGVQSIPWPREQTSTSGTRSLRFWELHRKSSLSNYNHQWVSLQHVLPEYMYISMCMYTYTYIYMYMQFMYMYMCMYMYIYNFLLFTYIH